MSATRNTAGDFHRSWGRLPIGRLDNIIGTGSALILAPHPDDESLGCGGLVATCVAAGRPPLVAILTDGAGSHPNSRAYPRDRLVAVRAGEARAAVLSLGLAADRLVFLNQPDTDAPRDGPRFDAVLKAVLGLIRRQAACTAILAPWRYDPHCDHEAASVLAAAAAKAAGIGHAAYPVWGWTLPPDAPVPGDPGGGFRLDVGAFLPAKRTAIRCHESQYGELITDDPAGFRLPADLLSVFEKPFETFVQP